jgi:hypothetical protein
MWSDSDYSNSESDEEDQQNKTGGFAFGRQEDDEEEDGAVNPVDIIDVEHDFDDLDKDILGDDDGADSDDGYKKPVSKGRKKLGLEKEKEEKSFMLFDFRRGENRWPEVCVFPLVSFPPFFSETHLLPILP